MSNEVSCQVLDVFFQRLRRDQIAPERLLQGVPYNPEHLRNKAARIDWSAFVVFMRNAGRIWSREDLLEIGESVFAAPALRTFSLIARLLFDATGFYKWVFEKQNGAGVQTWSCVEPKMEQIGPNRVLLELTLKPGYELCSEFFIVCLGNFRGMPRALGLPPADVKMTQLPRGAQFDVRVPDGGGFLARCRKAVALPFTAVSVARELKQSNENLQAKLYELSEARRALAAHAERLKIVNRLGREIAAHTELSQLALALTRVFEEGFRELGIIVLIASENSEAFDPVCQSGPISGSPTHSHQLKSGEEIVGRLDVFVREHVLPEQMSLLEDLIPWVSIALGNARSFALLREYRDQLSRKVEERTRELNEAMKQLAESLEQQREAIRVKTEFFDNVSHELRTPLTLILLAVESLIQKGPDVVTAEVREQLGGMHRSASRLLRLINDLLDLAKLGAGKMRVNYDPIEVHEFLSQLLAPFRIMAEQKGLALNLVGEPGEPIFADAEKLDVVFHNLISNALKFTTEGEVTVRIERSSDFVRVEVRDTGAGIGASDLPHIFNRFAQADERGTRRFGGTGIGLALVKELVELHGGLIEVESELGRGSTFRVTLPRGVAHIREELRERRALNLPVRNDRRRDSAVLQAELLRATASLDLDALPLQQVDDLSRPTVLVVEDDPEIRGYLKMILGTRYRVLEADNGKAGLDAAIERHPAVIVSDVMMPVMSGIQMLAAIRRTPQISDVPVILLTARHDVDARVGGLDDGANDYIGKPFAPRELVARIDTQLRLREASARVAQSERLAAMSLLTSGFAHEVRNPLNGLMNAIAPLKASIANPQEAELARSMLEVIEEAGERIRFLAESLLSMSRGSATHQEFAIAESIDSAQRALSWKLPTGVRVEKEMAPDLHVLGDFGALTQVWINVLDNALHAVGEAGTIRICAAREGGEVLVTISDSGPGIAPENLHRLFEPFFSTRAAGQGTGLGLALCKRIVLQHKGTIELKSEPGQGTRCIVRLPLHAATTALSETSAPEVKVNIPQARA